MPKFDYVVRNSQELKQKLHDIEKYTRERFKDNLFALSYNCYNNAMKCYAGEKSISEAKVCFTKAIAPLKSYHEAYDQIWIKYTHLLKKCIVNAKSPLNVSTCANTFAYKVYRKVKKLNLKYKTKYECLNVWLYLNNCMQPLLDIKSQNLSLIHILRCRRAN
eukprot:TRINITY_DN6551_c0_g1_i1.p1 TRINITY_DN6551_c0_g1~~TRINITY_DN6551_c0_g1_i1.p1  ORF type:complete len:162 (-),score=7.42 TRINITY_DN6551_c0_g1_i1:43-528(-)